MLAQQVPWKRCFPAMRCTYLRACLNNDKFHIYACMIESAPPLQFVAHCVLTQTPHHLSAPRGFVWHKTTSADLSYESMRRPFCRPGLWEVGVSSARERIWLVDK